MATKLVLDFERGGRITCTLFEKEAPKTCKLVLDTLPVENEVIHAQWAGEEIFFNGFPAKQEMGLENATRKMTPGDIAYNAPSKSFCIFYGRSIPRKAVDAEIDVNVFARADQVEEMAAIGKRVRRQGVEKVRISQG